MKEYAGYVLYIVVMAGLLGLIFITPVLAFEKSKTSDVLYDVVFPPFCHQKISRSLCLFKGTDGGYFVADCTPQSGVYISNDGKQKSIVSNGLVGYKMPVCSRDIGIFAGMLLGAFAYPFFRKVENTELPNKWLLILGLVPIGIDGTVQLISNIGIVLPVIGFYESTNLVRLVTGGIIGGIIPFFLLPILTVLAYAIIKEIRYIMKKKE